MKNRKTHYAVFMSIAVFVIAMAGCTDTSEDKKAISEDNTSINEIKQKTQDLIQAIGSYTADQRDEAVQRAATALNNLDERIDALEERLVDNWDQMNQAAREKARADLKALRKQRNKVAEWYGSLTNSSADAWEHTKRGFSDAYKALDDAWERAANEFRTNESKK